MPLSTDACHEKTDLKVIVVVQSFFVVYDLKSVGALKIEFVAPIPEQIATYTREMHCWGPNLFWHGCNEFQILGP